MEAIWGRAPRVGESKMVARYWRSCLEVDSRQKIVDKIMDTLKRLLPLTSQEGLLELNKIAVNLENKIYIVSTSQADYIRKISLKMLTMENNNQYAICYSLPSNYVGSGNRAPVPGGEPVMDAGDWRSCLQADSRQRVVNKIMESLKKYLPFTSQEGQLVIKEITVKFEEKIYTAATSLPDYLQKLSQKMLNMTTKFQNTIGDFLPSNYASNSSIPPAPAGELEMDTGDWRCQFLVDSRQRVVNKIMDSFKRHLPFSGQEGMLKLEKLAVKFEQKIYTMATSQPDYLCKISLKMLIIERNAQNNMGNYLPSNSASNCSRALYPGGEPAMDEGDWRNQLQVNSRHRICIKIMETLKRRIPFYGQEGLQELKKIAARTEQKIYSAATSKSEYLRKISLKMLLMETNSQNTIGTSLPSNSAGNTNRSPHPATATSMKTDVPLESTVTAAGAVDLEESDISTKAATIDTPKVEPEVSQINVVNDRNTIALLQSQVRVTWSAEKH